MSLALNGSVPVALCIVNSYMDVKKDNRIYLGDFNLRNCDPLRTVHFLQQCVSSAIAFEPCEKEEKLVNHRKIAMICKRNSTLLQ